MAPPIEVSTGVMKRSIDVGDGDTLEIMPLGAGSEVGRSCHLCTYKGKSVMFDCGVHPGYAGIASLPYFDEVDLSTVDALLVTHFHLDHCAAVPFLVGHTTFKGRILMTHPTKAIFQMLMADFVKLNKTTDAGEAIFGESDLKASMERIEVIDFHQEVRVPTRRPAARGGRGEVVPVASTSRAPARLAFGHRARDPRRECKGVTSPSRRQLSNTSCCPTAGLRNANSGLNNRRPLIQSLDSNAQTSNLKPQTSNLKPQTSNLKPQTANLKPQTSNLKPQTSNLMP